VTTTIPSATSLPDNCRVREERMAYFGEAIVLTKHRVQYFRCDKCGFIQSEAPYWLEEANSFAIIMALQTCCKRVSG
jgi:hypothetical protein